MKRNLAWSISMVLLAALLTMSACGRVKTTTSTATTPATQASTGQATSTAPAAVQTTSTAPATGQAPSTSEQPTYGGVLTVALATDLPGFDEATAVPWQTYTTHLTTERLLIGDWSKGPAGTNEISWTLANFPPKFEWVAGRVAESWELTDAQTITFHIRRGIHFHNKPPVNGRELTADDVLYTWNRLMSEQYKAFYWYMNFASAKVKPEVTAPDKWTIVVKCPPGQTGNILENFGDKVGIIPREMVEKYGDLRDWRNACGSGPFMLNDYVPQSSATLVKNPDYWMKDPVHPKNTLPYLDGVKMLIISDTSTRIAGLRTGKLDVLGDLTPDDQKSLAQSNPGLKWRSGPQTTWLIAMRSDTKPFDDIRVRRAMNMAVNKQAIAKDYYSGEAEILNAHVTNLPDFSDMYTPLDKLPESTRELFEYSPDKAKQLLSQAGYPTGFKTEVITYQAWVDLLSIVKADLAKVNVDMQITVVDSTTWLSIMNTNAHKQMLMQYGNTTNPYRLSELRYGTAMSGYAVKDPIIEAAYTDNYIEYFNPAKRNQIIKDTNLYALSQSWYIYLPVPYVYGAWQPWLGGYHGETSPGFQEVLTWPMFIWIEQDLKFQMTGRK